MNQKHHTIASAISAILAVGAIAFSAHTHSRIQKFGADPYFPPTMDLSTAVGTLTATHGGTGSASAPTSGQLPIGNAGGTAYAPQSLTGAIAITSAGVTSIASGATITSPSLNTDSTTATIQHLTVNAQTDNYTLVLTDDYKLVTLSNAGAKQLSIPTNDNVAFPTGTQITVIQIGAGQFTIAAVTPGTTTVLSNGGTAAAPKLRVQYSSATLIKTAADTWYVVGDIQ